MSWFLRRAPACSPPPCPKCASSDVANLDHVGSTLKWYRCRVCNRQWYDPRNSHDRAHREAVAAEHRDHRLRRVSTGRT
jgi:transposase-like protein